MRAWCHRYHASLFWSGGGAAGVDSIPAYQPARVPESEIWVRGARGVGAKAEEKS